MLLEHFPVASRRRCEAAVDQTGHDFAQDRDVILGFRIALGALDAKLHEILAQARERPLMQESGEIIGAVGQQLAAAEPDEEIEVLALDLVRRGVFRGLGERGMREPERACIGRAACATRASRSASGARDEQRGEQPIFLGARGFGFVERNAVVAQPS